MSTNTTWEQLVDSINSVTNRGAVSGSITTSGGSYTIPKGYHNGSGKVTGPTLTKLIGTNVTLNNAANLLSGYTAYGKNGTKYTGTNKGYDAGYTAGYNAANSSLGTITIPNFILYAAKSDSALLDVNTGGRTTLKFTMGNPSGYYYYLQAKVTGYNSSGSSTSLFSRNWSGNSYGATSHTITISSYTKIRFELKFTSEDPSLSIPFSNITLNI